MKRSVLFGVALLVAATASAQTQKRHEVHIGLGGQSCGQWLAASESLKQPTSSDNEKNQVLTGMAVSWVQGFLLAAGGYVPPDRKDDYLQAVPTGSSVREWLDKFCREQPPTTTVLAGAAKLTFELIAQLGLPAK